MNSINIVVQLPPGLGYKGLVADDIDHLANVLKHQNKKYSIQGLIVIGDADNDDIGDE